MTEPRYRIVSLEEEKRISDKYAKEALEGRLKDAPPISLGSEFPQSPPSHRKTEGGFVMLDGEIIEEW